MYLSKLEIFGFKSFADRTAIEFDSGICAIVGPNGSGKSNIVDALRWVLGEQGDKALRSGKREDVVFNGTKFRKPLSVAEVAVTIQNNKGKLPTEYSEVQIARRFFRSGETEYFLNGTKVRLKDIKELFLDTGIGSDAYSVIELKMVETILSDVKNERRKLFEEAAGVVSYKHNRDLTYNRLDAVHESLIRVNDIIREKQRNVNALERQAKRNEEAKLVSEELKSAELKTGKYDFDQLVREIKEIKSKESDNLSLKARLSEDMAANDIILDKYRTELQELDTKLSEINVQLTLKREEINLIEKDNLVLSEKIKNLQDNIKRLNSENQSIISQQNKNSGRKEELTDKIKVLNNTISISEESLNEKKSRVDSSIEVINSKKNEMIILGKQIKDINKLVSDNKSEYQKYKINFENNLLQLEKLSDQISSNIVQIDILSGEKNILEEKLYDLKLKLKSAEKVLREKEDEKIAVSKLISGSEKELSAIVIAHQKVKSQADYLQNLSENFEDYAEGVRYLLKDVKGKNILTVLDAIEVEDKFKIAIETALGEISNYLIVNESENTDNFINLLAENKKGKVTFIQNDILNKKSFGYAEFDSEDPEFIGTKGVYGFADKFVKCTDDKYILLMKYILDEYVIVDNMNTAKRLAQDSYYKFITIDGDIFTKGFVRAGGEIKEGSIRLGRQKTIDSLTAESEAYQIRIREHEAKLKELRGRYESINPEKHKKEYEDIKMIFDETEKEISKIDFRKEQINKAISDNEAIYENLNNENKSLNEQINKFIEAVNKSENEQYNLDKELIFLTDEFNEIEKQYSGDSADFNNFNLEFLKIKNELKNEEQNLFRLNNTISFNEKQIESNNEIILDNEVNYRKYNFDLETNNEKLEKLKEGIKEVESRYETEKIIYDEKRSHQHETDVTQRQIRIDFDNVSQRLINAQIKIKENEIKSEQVKDYILKKYEKDISQNENLLSEGESDGYYDDFDVYASKKNIEDLNERLKRLGGGYQQILFEDFENEKTELLNLIEQKDDLLESEKDIKKTIDKINKEARDRFMHTFELIRENFIKIFKELFSEGDEANLKIIFEEDENGKTEEDPLEAKIEIIAKPRGKRPTSIELLSGGEKTLTAIALLFAIYLVKPSPFCVLDEVDAPLDVANLARFNSMIRKFSDNTQFILITHNERTMESVDRLYGVTMQEAGITTIVETKFKTDEKILA